MQPTAASASTQSRPKPKVCSSGSTRPRRRLAHRPRSPREAPTHPYEARLAIIRNCEIPRAGEDPALDTPGADLLRLIHSLSHRIIRKISAFAGIERDALSEYLIPLHLGFVVFAASRGDFVLGGLQAMFENDLDKALREVVHGEPRCALDPGCTRNGSACAVCLHVGEPSCRYYNQFLARTALFGPDGYLNA